MAKGDNFLKRGLTKTHRALYVVWKTMRQRCTNQNCAGYPRYGARGIVVCSRWDDFALFLEDMGDPPFEGASIERKDNDGHYEPGNCIWATAKDQAVNRHTTIFVDVDGDELCLKDACARLGLPYKTVHMRIRRSGYTPEEALTAPILRGGARSKGQRASWKLSL